MRMLSLLVAFLSLLQVYAQFHARCFSMPQCDNSNISVETCVTRDTVIPLDFNHGVMSLSVTGNFRLMDETSYIRILVKSAGNSEFLVYENYSILSDSMSGKFSRIGMESIALNKIIPCSLIIQIENAALTLDSVHLAKSIETEQEYARRSVLAQNGQSAYLAKQLNQNLIRQKKTWRAVDTHISRYTYEEKKALFGGFLPPLFGFEYYGSGVFVIPGTPLASSALEAKTNAIVNEWDWRNRHGKNWMTPVKKQGGCWSCWAFGAVGTLEAYINLYYNQLLNYDLSEQELISCSSSGDCSGGSARLAMRYIEEHGIVEEECFAYAAANVNCKNKCASPLEIVKVDSHVNISNVSEDSLKRLLFKAPVGISISKWGHAIVLAGYKTLHAGDIVSPASNDFDVIVVGDDSPLIGKTAWLIKNSWGSDTNWGEGGGYGYVVVDMAGLRNSYYLSGKVHSNIHADSDVNCEDADGDGYYFWGIGSKPSNCPSWVPDVPDGDDSDYQKDPIDNNGWLMDNAPNTKDTLYIKEDTTWGEHSFLHNHVCICEKASLTIKKHVKAYRDVAITIRPHATLIVDGGILEHVNIKAEKQSDIIIIGEGEIRSPVDSRFYLPTGGNLHMSSGKIK